MRAPILRRASALTAVSFAWAAALNVLPQLYLLRHHTERKGLMLSAVLFAGTVASMAGVSFSRARLGRPSRALDAVSLALFAGVVFELRPLPLYLLAYVLFRFTSNGLFNRLDHALLDAAGARFAELHATATTGFTILGQLTGPLAFVALEGHPRMALGMLAALGGWWTFALRDVASAAPRARTTSPPAAAPPVLGAAVSRRAVAFVAYGLLVLTGVSGFFSQLVFLLRDYLGMADAGRVGGIFMMGTGVVSMATVLVSSRRGGGLSRGTFLSPALLGAIAIVLFAGKPGAAGLVLAGALAGVAGGQFLLATRVCAATWEGPPGRAAMLSLYNNLANVAALVAYALIFVLSLGEGSAHYHAVLLGLLVTLFAAASVVSAASPFVVRLREAS